MTDLQSTRLVNPSAIETLYRLRSMSGDLLYVGITTNWPSRMKQHQADKPWWSEVANIELVSVIGTRSQIEAIEKAIIKNEAPTYNVVHNGLVRQVAPKVATSRAPFGREIIVACGPTDEFQNHPTTWQVNEADGTCVLLAAVGDYLHHEDLGWGEFLELTQGGQWLAKINFGVGEGVHHCTLADPKLREQRVGELVDIEHLERDDGIGRLFIGSHCEHSFYGNGTVMERDGQAQFLVRFPNYDDGVWVKRFDSQVVRWGK